MPTMVSTFSFVDSASIKDSTGDLPLASRCDSKRETQTAVKESVRSENGSREDEV